MSSFEVESIPVYPTIGDLNACSLSDFSLPAYIVEQPFDGLHIPTISARVKAVGRHVACITGGSFKFEGKANVGTGLAPHIDGVTPLMWQINSSYPFGEYHLEDGEVPGTRFTVIVHESEKPIEIELLKKYAGPFKDPYKTTIYLDDLNHPSGREREGLAKRLIADGYPQLTRTRCFQGFMPKGAVIVFVNGTGENPRTFYFHQTESAVRKANGVVVPTVRFPRIAALARVVV